MPTDYLGNVYESITATQPLMMFIIVTTIACLVAYITLFGKILKTRSKIAYLLLLILFTTLKSLLHLYWAHYEGDPIFSLLSEWSATLSYLFSNLTQTEFLQIIVSANFSGKSRRIDTVVIAIIVGYVALNIPGVILAFVKLGYKISPFAEIYTYGRIIFICLSVILDIIQTYTIFSELRIFANVRLQAARRRAVNGDVLDEDLLEYKRITATEHRKLIMLYSLQLLMEFGVIFIMFNAAGTTSYEYIYYRLALSPLMCIRVILLIGIYHTCLGIVSTTMNTIASRRSFSKTKALAKKNKSNEEHRSGTPVPAIIVAHSDMFPQTETVEMHTRSTAKKREDSQTSTRITNIVLTSSPNREEIKRSPRIAHIGLSIPSNAQ